MKIYKWEGQGHWLGATVIVVADCLRSANEIIEKELIDTGLAKSWEENKKVKVIQMDGCKLIWADNGDY